MRARHRQLRARLGSGSAPLRITSLMDIFTSLLFFLLKSYVTDGQAGTVTPGVQLPASAARGAPFDAPVVAVTNHFVALDGEVVATTSAAGAPDLVVEPLYAALRQLRAAHGDISPRLVVQGDRSIDFALLHRVMYTSQRAGFTQVALAVLQDEAAVAALGSSEP